MERDAPGDALVHRVVFEDVEDALAVLGGLPDAGGGVGEAALGHAGGDGDLVGDPGPSVGDERDALLVAADQRLDARSLRERAVDRIGAVTRHAKQVVDAALFERGHHRAGTGPGHYRHNRSSVHIVAEIMPDAGTQRNRRDRTGRSVRSVVGRLSLSRVRERETGGEGAFRCLVLAAALLVLAGCRTGSAAGAAAAGGTVASPTPTAAAASAAAVRPAGAVEVDRERIAREATWAPGQLREHFQKHGREGPWPTVEAYDASARETIRLGFAFTYVDRESNAERLGFYDKASTRFTSVTRDGRRITTQFRPDRGEAYVRGLEHSTYR